MIKPLSRRNLRRMMTGDRRKIVKQMKKDLGYLLKPKPKFWPNWFWKRVLKKVLNTNESVIVKKTLCQ